MAGYLKLKGRHQPLPKAPTARISGNGENTQKSVPVHKIVSVTCDHTEESTFLTGGKNQAGTQYLGHPGPEVNLIGQRYGEIAID